MLNFLYNIIIFPLTQILEFFYQFIYETTLNKGIAIIALSFIVTLCTLPLYMVAEGWQEAERKKQEALKPGIQRIKKAFKGDEQYMILNTFYRQNHYNPIFALRSSLSLLIQIPFFIAAFHFISELGTLKGYPFLFIKDFGHPDATFHIGSFAINVLPIAMTLINCISGAIYSKGHAIQEKIQIYVFAAVFLLILYNEPSGLVVYWTMNNILSLVKNIFFKLKNPKKVLYILLCILAGICIIAPFTVMSYGKRNFRIFLTLIGCVLPFVPFAVIGFAKTIFKNFKSLDENPSLRCGVFFLSAGILAILCGLVIPSTLMESEPHNYCYVDSYRSPFIFLRTVFAQAIGLWIFWPGAFYGLFSTKIKKLLAVCFSCGAIIGLVNCFAFSGQYGPIEPTLLFMQPQSFVPPVKNIIINALVLAAVTAAIILVLQKKLKFIQTACIIVLLSMSAISIKNIAYIQKEYKTMNPPSFSNKLDPIFHLSKTEKNVLLIMQDRCYSPFIPSVFEELPEDKAKFDGFTYYPNTISMGMLTMIGTPGLFGGYDYTTYQINKDTTKTLQQKHNEALLTLPVLFTENGFRAEVANLPYENYLEQPITDMYKDYPKIERHDVLATYTDYWYNQHGMEKEPYISTQILRNFIWFSLFKVLPPVLRGGIYHRDYWLSYNKWDDSARFVDNYSVLDYLPELTDFDDKAGNLIILDNEATHEPTLLQAPEYTFKKNVTNIGNGKYNTNTEFSTMCGVFKCYTEFFDYLKANGVYDNTRIIIVSDHGMFDFTDASKNLGFTPGLNIYKPTFVATLMVKDFNEHHELKTDMTFMTNADTPWLCSKELIKDAKNPFTGNPLKVENKADYAILNSSPAQSTRIRYNKKFDVNEDEWYCVKDNIFVNENWSRYKKNDKQD